MAKDEKLVNRIYKDFKYSFEKLRILKKRIKEDFKFEQGKQWDDDDIESLRKVGVKALTINKIKPIIKLITGIERQSRSDYKAFPEGGEDELKAEMVSRLIKNIVKNSRLEVKHSEQFKNGCIGGACFIEPYIDYSFDLINGDLKWKKVSVQDVYWDPDFQEYDMSDARFMIKTTKDLLKDDLLALFPDKEKEIEKIVDGKINVDTMKPDGEISRETDDYPSPDSEDKDIGNERSETTYDLIDYYYKELKNKYYAIIQERGIIKDFDTEEEAQTLADQTGGIVISRKVPVIMQAQAVGNTLLYNNEMEFYPRWKTYPLIPYFAEFITENLDDYSLKIQGIVRGIKDLNLEFNKRRTQELRHINSSINSGFEIEKGSLDNKELAKLKKAGASPGVVIERKRGSAPINRIQPMPLSQGHAQLAAENAQDLKEASGVNPDLLANDSQSQSGRAILFKQRQGLQMIQEMLDNFGETKRSTGLFILSQLPELFTVESAMHVLGDAFIAENFTVPIAIIKDRALDKIEKGANLNQLTKLEQSVVLQYPDSQKGDPIVDEQNQPITAVDFDQAIVLINNMLNNQELSKYDIAIGEGPFSETINMANFMDLKELATQGVPIPPDVLIQSSMLPESKKKGILRSLAQQAQIAQAQLAK